MSERPAHDLARDEHGHGCFAIDLDGQVQSFHYSIRDALVARGVLYCDTLGVWRLLWHGFDLERERARWMACCDFCSARPVCWMFRCLDFEIPESSLTASLRVAPMMSTGEWDACATCGSLINAGRWSALLAHCDAAKRDDESLLPRRMRKVLHEMRAEIQRRFRAHRRGDGVPVPPSPFGH
jgi:hypothetical protein